MESLWQAARSGKNADAVAAIIEATYKLAYAGASAKGLSSISSRADIADAAQTALVYAVECFQAGSFEDMTLGEFRVWLYGQGKNKAGLALRKHRAQCRDVRKTQAIRCAYAGKFDANHADNVEAVSILIDQFRCDPESQSILKGLMNGSTYPEIGAATGLSRHQVKSRVNRMREFAAS